MITTIVIYNSKLTPSIAFFISNLSYIKDNLTDIKETSTGFKVLCNFKATQKKQNEIKKTLKHFTGSNSINFIMNEK